MCPTAHTYLACGCGEALPGFHIPGPWPHRRQLDVDYVSPAVAATATATAAFCCCWVSVGAAVTAAVAGSGGGGEGGGVVGLFAGTGVKALSAVQVDRREQHLRRAVVEVIEEW
jgi:hypothetical protein